MRAEGGEWARHREGAGAVGSGKSTGYASEGIGGVAGMEGGGSMEAAGAVGNRRTPLLVRSG